MASTSEEQDLLASSGSAEAGNGHGESSGVDQTNLDTGAKSSASAESQDD